MNGLQPKKLMILYILDILKKYSDQNHPLTQKAIGEYLLQDYGMSSDRKAIRRNLMDLMDAGYPVRTNSEQVRNVVRADSGKAEESTVYSDFYYEHPFTEGELRLMINGILFSKGISHRHGKELIEKLEAMAGENFHYRTGHIHSVPENQSENKQIFYTLEILDEAIGGKKKVGFIYNHYGTDKKLHPRLDENGNAKLQTVSPYQIVTCNGRFYLICNHELHDNLVYYRIDRMTDIKILDEASRALRSIPEAAEGLDLPRHLAEHMYMFPGETKRVVFRAKSYLLNDLMDWFGNDLDFLEEKGEEIKAAVRVNQTAMRMWAVQYAKHVRVLEPKELAEKIRMDLKEAAAVYDRGNKAEDQ